MKCCTNNEKSVSSGTEEDITPDLEELDSVNDDEHSTLNQILQKLSDCNNHPIFSFHRSNLHSFQYVFFPKNMVYENYDNGLVNPNLEQGNNFNP